MNFRLGFHRESFEGLFHPGAVVRRPVGDTRDHAAEHLDEAAAVIGPRLGDAHPPAAGSNW